MRLLIFTAIVLLSARCQFTKDRVTSSSFTEAVSIHYDTAMRPFYHGVASGDPLTDKVIIWTRVTPEDSVPSIEVSWEISTNEAFEPVVKHGVFSTSPQRDYTVKIDVDGLAPDTRYYYRFQALEETSSLGRTKTLPKENVDSLRFAVVSCSNWQHGYFNAYDRIAEKDLDAVLHLGDYIYEYGVNNAKNVDRRHLPEHEVITLSDYRIRYSQYHLDSGLRKMRQQHPLIAIWDDHEVANNTYVEGAQNHQPEEGDFLERKAAARQAYYEWIPIREDEKHYRAFTFGNLAELIMLDERQEGKTKPAEGISDPVYRGKERSMLGRQQLNWLESELTTASATWRVIGNQVMFTDFDRSEVNSKNPRNMDSWDGYPVEKEKIAGIIRENNLRNIIFLTGDTHASWAFEVVVDGAGSHSGTYQPLAVEFGTPSVSSANANESSPDDTVIIREQTYPKMNPHLKYVNQRDHGYLLLTLSPEKARADWYYVNILRPDEKETLARSIRVDVNSNSLK
ncbi:MAG TPA: alkaline phosphatase D family protein [Chryseosolibacter sp.]